MRIRKDMIFAVLTTFCICALMFAVIPIRSGLPYDPWADIQPDTPDGTIDIKDVSGVARLYGTSGDSTKNVTVTNFPIKRTLNASLADNLVIDSYQVWYFEANVEGYSKVTLVIRVDYIEGSPILSANIRFIIGGVHTPKIYSNNTLTVGTYFLLQSYEVIGPIIEIELDPSGGPQRVSLGIYATD